MRAITSSQLQQPFSATVQTSAKSGLEVDHVAVNVDSGVFEPAGCGKSPARWALIQVLPLGDQGADAGINTAL